MARLGIVLYHGIDSGPELQTYGRLAEAAGFESLWVTERYFHEETFTLLGYLAAVTQRTKLGLAVTNPYTRHPALLGMASATLDRLCGGRFILGLGRSERGVIQDRLGLPYRQPRATLADTIAVLRRLLAGDQVTTSGGQSTLHNVRLAIQPVQHPLPIYLAAIGPQALRLAGAIADGVVLNAYVPSAYVRYAVAEIRQAAREAGRNPEEIAITCMLVVRLTEDPAALWPSLKQRLVRLLAEPYVGEMLLEKGGFDAGRVPALRAAAAQGGETAAVGLISDAMVEAFYLVGSAARCRERIAEYRQAGVDVPLLLPRLHDFQQVAEALGEW
jgi:5,10-methylenetetrahydromethanopterin reductase